MSREPGIHDSLVDSLLQSLLVLLDVRHEHERLSEIYTPLSHNVMNTRCCRSLAVMNGYWVTGRPTAQNATPLRILQVCSCYAVCPILSIAPFP